jgi:predicted nuclease with TOPRIM domain
MADEILQRLDELKAGQDALIARHDALQAGQDALLIEVGSLSVGQQDLRTRLDRLETKVDRLEVKVDGIDERLTSHMAGTSDSVERLTATIEAIHKKISGGDAPPRIARSR